MKRSGGAEDGWRRKAAKTLGLVILGVVGAVIVSATAEFITGVKDAKASIGFRY